MNFAFLQQTSPPVIEGTSQPIYLGLLICVLGNTLISFALNLQKYVHNKLKSQYIYQTIDNNNTEASESKKLNYLKSRLWWLAQFLMIFGEGGNFLAYGFAPASLIAPLGTVSLISNSIIAPFLLGEVFRIRDALGIILSILGAIIVVATNGGSESDEIPPEEFFNLFLKTKVLTYILVCSVLVFILNKLSKKWGHKIIFIDLAIVGIFGSFTVLSTKGVSVQLSQLGWKFFYFPSNFILIAVLVLTGMVQIKYLNQSLHHFTSTQVVPTQFVSFTLNVIIGSGIVYDDFAKFTIGQSITFSLGCLLTFFGVYLISSLRPSENLPSSSSDSSYIGSQVETNNFPNSSSSSIIINISSISQGIQPTPLSYSLNETSSLQTFHSHASPPSKSHLFYSQASSPNAQTKQFASDYRHKSFANYGSTP